MVKKGTFASPAMARASRVLPVPGEPTSSAPLGILPPRRANLVGSFRNSTISCSSSRASSMPATSSNVTRPCFSVSNLALDRPKPIAPEPRILLHLAHHEEGDAEDQQERQRLIEQEHPQGRGRLRRAVEADALLAKALDQGRIGDDVGAEAAVVGKLAVDRFLADGDALDAALVDLGEEIGIRQRALRRRGAAADQLDDQHQRQDDPGPDEQALHPAIARRLLVATGAVVVGHGLGLSPASRTQGQREPVTP